MANHSSILAWRILWTEEPGGLYSPCGLKESDTTEQLTHTQQSIACVFSLVLQRKRANRMLLLLFNRPVVSNSLQPYGLQHARFPCPSLISKSLHKFVSIESVILSNHSILCRPLLLLSSIFPSIGVFSQ
ncbi:unnamed protein product [Rangifer tarandus platyrhynchus]|uniref:Uncharacterized protein n=1 Tax=Rangifer tarandus platyrhynchus TaxID=3082113 RepID=A0AC59ZW48_RANTA